MITLFLLLLFAAGPQTFPPGRTVIQSNITVPANVDSWWVELDRSGCTSPTTSIELIVEHSLDGGKTWQLAASGKAPCGDLKDEKGNPILVSRINQGPTTFTGLFRISVDVAGGSVTVNVPNAGWTKH